MSGNRVTMFFSVAVAVFLCAPHSRAQEQWRFPDSARNLQVLPKDMGGRQLSQVMRGFTGSLGVRCNYCHVGEEGKPLSTFDFASDANPNKARAREMVRMLGDIKEHLKKIEPSGDRPVNVSCATCHHGRPRPMTLREELGEQYRTGGVDAALAHYAELKKRYYGRDAYDFSERSLNAFGYELMENNDLAGSIRVFTLNTQENPDSPNVWDSLAEAYMKSGDMKKAGEYYQKELALDPGNENAVKMLKQIKDSTGK
jgi:tetratricopeptide (TPR) repeat protein